MVKGNGCLNSWLNQINLPHLTWVLEYHYRYPSQFCKEDHRSWWKDRNNSIGGIQSRISCKNNLKNTSLRVNEKIKKH